MEKSQRWECALGLLQLCPPSLVAFDAAVSASSGRWTLSLQLLRRLRVLRLAPNGVTYTAALEACGRAPAVLALLCEMRASRCGLDVVAYSQAAEACEACGDPSALLEWLANCERSSLLLLS
ncbi:unnamed protein product [Effrenium voratum]|nr:unnamed protein product [Effrenium voratum]